MPSRLDYSKAKARARLGQAEPTYYNTSGWRTEYPERFPVVRSSLANRKQDQSKVLTGSRTESN